jgi:GntR family transcriptional regulator
MHISASVGSSGQSASFVPVTIDHDGPVPVYRQLAALLRDAIRRGEYQPGRAIPSAKRLAQQYEVAEVTARKSILILVDEGLLEGVQGRGVFVVERHSG